MKEKKANILLVDDEVKLTSVLKKSLEREGHSVWVANDYSTALKLLEELKEEMEVPAELIKSGMKLDKFYILTRYPNGFDAGKPSDFFDEDDAEEAIKNAEKIIEFCKNKIHKSR